MRYKLERDGEVYWSDSISTISSFVGAPIQNVKAVIAGKCKTVVMWKITDTRKGKR